MAAAGYSKKGPTPHSRHKFPPRVRVAVSNMPRSRIRKKRGVAEL